MHTQAIQAVKAESHELLSALWQSRQAAKRKAVQENSRGVSKRKNLGLETKINLTYHNIQMQGKTLKVSIKETGRVKMLNYNSSK